MEMQLIVLELIPLLTGVGASYICVGVCCGGSVEELEGVATRLVNCGFDAAIELARHKHGGYGSIDLYGTRRRRPKLFCEGAEYIGSSYREVHSVPATGNEWKGCGRFYLFCVVFRQAQPAHHSSPSPQPDGRSSEGSWLESQEQEQEPTPPQDAR